MLKVISYYAIVLSNYGDIDIIVWSVCGHTMIKHGP